MDIEKKEQISNCLLVRVSNTIWSREKNLNNQCYSV